MYQKSGNVLLNRIGLG